MLKAIQCCQVRETTSKPDTGLNRNAQKLPRRVFANRSQERERSQGLLNLHDWTLSNWKSRQGMKCCQYQKKVAYCWISSWDKPSRAERGGSKLWVRSGLAGILYQRLICCVNKHVGFMLLPRGRGQQLHLLHTMSDACTLWSWMDFSHEKGVCLEALGIQKLLIALLCETGVWIRAMEPSALALQKP